MAIRVANHFCDELQKYDNYRGGKFWPGIFSVGFHVAFGSFTAATPDGRYSGDVLGNGLTPTTGNEKTGPTAIMNSISKLPLTRICNGANLNMRFDGNRIRTENLLALIQGYFQRGGMQIQFNMVDSKTLQDAKRNPQHHQDLVVRISGYSALFTGLTETAQDEIISRTEHELQS